MQNFNRLIEEQLRTLASSFLQRSTFWFEEIEIYDAVFN